MKFTCMDDKLWWFIQSLLPPFSSEGRPRLFDKEGHHGVRYNAERFFGWLENYRNVATRYERLPNVFLGLIRLASSIILWRVSK